MRYHFAVAAKAEKEEGKAHTRMRNLFGKTLT
jgi:hypothetical protein